MSVCVRVHGWEAAVAPTHPHQLKLNGFLNKKNLKIKKKGKKCSQGLCYIPLDEHKQTDQKAIQKGGVGGGEGA